MRENGISVVIKTEKFVAQHQQQDRENMHFLWNPLRNMYVK